MLLYCNGKFGGNDLSYKIATYISLVLLGLINVIYLVASINIADYDSDREFGPAFYPLILSVILFILIIASFIKTFIKKNEDEQYLNVIDNLKKVTPVIIVIVLFIVLWSYFGYFYILSFFLLVALFVINKPSILKSIKKLSFYLIIATGYVLILFIIFSVFLSFDL